MKGRILILDALGTRGCAALLNDGILEALVVDPSDETPLVGAIYRGVAARPMKGQGGIFVDLPGGARGFLRQTGGISPGQTLLVQLTAASESERDSGKALALSTRLLFKSRFAIITPGAPGVNVSRRVPQGEPRAELIKRAADEMAGAAPDLGLILRSACADAALDSVAQDIVEMRALAEAVLADVHGAPELLVDGPSAHDLALRDWCDPAPDEITQDAGSFAHYGVDALIDGLCAPRVALNGSASMEIEPTRALIAIDVNTGNDTSPAAALKANIAAARALPRQLMLRGLGGQVVIDFAPISKKDRGTLDQVLKAAFKEQGRDVHLAGWTVLGLYELTRKRDRMPLAQCVAGL